MARITGSSKFLQQDTGSALPDQRQYGTIIPDKVRKDETVNRIIQRE